MWTTSILSPKFLSSLALEFFLVLRVFCLQAEYFLLADRKVSICSQKYFYLQIETLFSLSNKDNLLFRFLQTNLPFYLQVHWHSGY